MTYPDDSEIRQALIETYVRGFGDAVASGARVDYMVGTDAHSSGYRAGMEACDIALRGAEKHAAKTLRSTAMAQARANAETEAPPESGVAS